MSENKEPESTPQNNTIGTIDNYNYEILSEDYKSSDMSFKLIVIGESGVGKSCLTNKAIKNTFYESYNPTINFEIFTFNIRFNGKVVKLQIWDTCGMELYHSLITNFYRSSSLAIIVYSINSQETFDNVEKWLKELRSHSNPDVKVFLIGNKTDLEEEREVTTEQGENFYKQNNLNLFLESSAKTGFNTQKIFIKAAEILYEDYIKYQDDNSSNDMGSTNDNNNINKKRLDNYNNNNKKKKVCC